MNRQATLIALFVALIAITFYIQARIQQIQQILLGETVASIALRMDLVCDMFEFVVETGHWDVKICGARLAFIASKIDALPFQYCELFDENFNSLSTRTEAFPGHPFRPEQFPDLMERFCKENAGSAIVKFDPVVVPVHDFYLYWRWVPASKDYDDRLLFVTGGSCYAVQSEISHGLSHALSIISGILAVMMAWKIFGFRLLIKGRARAEEINEHTEQAITTLFRPSQHNHTDPGSHTDEHKTRTD